LLTQFRPEFIIHISTSKTNLVDVVKSDVGGEKVFDEARGAVETQNPLGPFLLILVHIEAQAKVNVKFGLIPQYSKVLAAPAVEGASLFTFRIESADLVIGPDRQFHSFVSMPNRLAASIRCIYPSNT